MTERNRCRDNQISSAPSAWSALDGRHIRGGKPGPSRSPEIMPSQFSLIGTTLLFFPGAWSRPPFTANPGGRDRCPDGGPQARACCRASSKFIDLYQRILAAKRWIVKGWRLRSYGPSAKTILEVSDVYPVAARSKYFHDTPLPSLWSRHDAAGQLVPANSAIPMSSLWRTGALDL
jgi:hypothetical protein